MARRRQLGDKKILFSKLLSVWTDISVADWLLLACELCPEGRFTRHGPHIKGHCPFHDDSTASFCITPAGSRGGIAYCFGCRKQFTNPIHLVAAMRKCSHGDAVLFVRKRYGLKALIPDALYEKVRDHERHQAFKNEIAEFICQQLLDAIKLWPDEAALSATGLYWTKPAIDFLMSRHLGEIAPNELRPIDEVTPPGPDPWGIWQALCGSQTIGVLAPTAALQARFGVDSDQFKWYASYFGEWLGDGAKYVGWVVFVLHDAPRSVCRFKIRSPNDAKEMRMVDDPYKAEMNEFRGFFGLNYYRTFFELKSPDDSYVHTVNVHEGEFDTLAVMAQQIRRGSEDFFALALGGASAQPLDILHNFGVSRVQVMPDDDKGGVEFAKNCIERTQSRAMSFQVFDWPTEYGTYVNPNNPAARIKDADEAILALGYPKWARHVMDNDNYLSLQGWCFDRAVDAINRSAVNDTRQQSRIAQEWGAYISNSHELTKFCTDLAEVYELDPTLLMRDISSKDEDEEMFVERLGRALLDHFHPVGIQNAEGRKRIMLLWNKKTRATDTVVLNDERAVETLLAPYFGAVYEFVRDHVGGPQFLAQEGEEALLPMQVKVKKYREYLTIAFLRMAKGLPAVDAGTSKGQGMHLKALDDGTTCAYVVNGRDVFHLTYASDGGFSASMLDGPSHNDVVFANEGKAWMPNLTPALIESNVDVVTLFDRVRQMVSVGWSWRNQELDATFLAAYLMCLSVMSVFHRQTAIFVTGEFSSGKSRFVGGLISGHEFPRMQLVAHSVLMNHYTPASIRQKRNNSSLALVLEEFEDYNNNERKAINVRGVLEMTRDLISETTVDISVGTTTGEAKTFYIRFPMICAAVRPLQDAVALSRFVTFELTHDPKRTDPQVTLLNQWGELGMRRTRQELAVGFLRHVPALQVIQAEIEQEFASGALMPAHAQSRFRESMYPILTMLKFLQQEAVRLELPAGLVPDYKRFALEFAESRRDQLTRLKATTENEHIFETIIGSQIQVQNNAERISNTTSIRKLLGDFNTLAEINKTQQGVYFDDKMEWMIVNWIEATQGVLMNTKYRSSTSNYLKQVSERSPFHVSQDDVKASRVLDRMVHVMGPCQKSDLITVFSVKHMLDEVRKRTAEAMQKPMGGLTDAEPKDAADKPQESDDIIA